LRARAEVTNHSFLDVLLFRIFRVADLITDSLGVSACDGVRVGQSTIRASADTVREVPSRRISAARIGNSCARVRCDWNTVRAVPSANTLNEETIISASTRASSVFLGESSSRARNIRLNAEISNANVSVVARLDAILSAKEDAAVIGRHVRFACLGADTIVRAGAISAGLNASMRRAIVASARAVVASLWEANQGSWPGRISGTLVLALLVLRITEVAVERAVGNTFALTESSASRAIDDTVVGVFTLSNLISWAVAENASWSSNSDTRAFT
jgi:hypothetical protein